MFNSMSEACCSGVPPERCWTGLDLRMMETSSETGGGRPVLGGFGYPHIGFGLSLGAVLYSFSSILRCGSESFVRSFPVGRFLDGFLGF